MNSASFNHHAFVLNKQKQNSARVEATWSSCFQNHSKTVSQSSYIFPACIPLCFWLRPLRAAPVGGALARRQVYDRRDPPATTAAVDGSASLKRWQRKCIDGTVSAAFGVGSGHKFRFRVTQGGMSYLFWLSCWTPQVLVSVGQQLDFGAGK